VSLDSVPSSNLASLLSSSAETPLLSISGAELETFTEGPAATDRHYSLVLFLTASAQCVACRAVEKELEVVAAAYEAARYPEWNPEVDEDDDDAPTVERRPAHHIFFLSLDAHRDFRPAHLQQLSKAPDMRNMPWFQSKQLTKVPQLLFVDFTLPGGMERDEGWPIVAQSAANSTRPPVQSAAARREQRREASYQRYLDREARLDAEWATANPELMDALTRASSPSSPPSAPTPNLPAWRDPSQTHSYALMSGVRASQLAAWLRSLTNVVTDKKASINFDARGLHRSQVVRPGGLDLPSFATKPAAEVNPSGESFLSRWFWSFEPFLPSFICFALLFLVWLKGRIQLAFIACAFFLWNVVGAMNNILKHSPYLGVSQAGLPQLLASGHASFVLESAFVAVIYACCAGVILSLNQVQLFERFQVKLNPAVVGTGKASEGGAQASGEQKNANGILDSSSPTSVSDSNPSSAAPPARSPFMLYPLPLLPAPLGFTTRHWLFVCVATMHVCFSILRNVYTK
jgi:hypothetical protein